MVAAPAPNFILPERRHTQELMDEVEKKYMAATPGPMPTSSAPTYVGPTLFIETSDSWLKGTQLDLMKGAGYEIVMTFLAFNR